MGAQRNNSMAPLKIQFYEQPLCGLSAYPFRHNTALLEKNYHLHINYMLRSNFLLVPCLA
jgi:hypothetical protein